MGLFRLRAISVSFAVLRVGLEIHFPEVLEANIETRLTCVALLALVAHFRLSFVSFACLFVLRDPEEKSGEQQTGVNCVPLSRPIPRVGRHAPRLFRPICVPSLPQASLRVNPNRHINLVCLPRP